MMRKFLAALTMWFVASFAIAFAAPSGYPTPVPTAAPTAVPQQISQYAILAGCFHNTNGNCPAPSGSGQITDWQNIAAKVQYVETDARAYGLASQAGFLGILAYSDPVFIHGGISIGSTSYCPSDTNPLPTGILMFERSYNNSIVVPNSNQTTCGGQNVATEIGDIRKPYAASFWQNVVKSNNLIFSSSVGGNTYASRSGMTVLRVDDALAPLTNNANNTLYCFGPGHLTTTGTITSCTSVSSSAPAITADDSTIVPQAYPHWIPQDYLDGTRSFFRAMKLIGLPVWYNNAYDPDVTEIFYNQPDRANVVGAQCENCIARNGSNLWIEPIWQNHINAEIVTSSQGVVFHVFHPVENSAADMTYTYASSWLGMMDSTKLAMTEQCGGSLSAPTSTMCISPLALLVPSQPISDPSNLVFNPFAAGYSAANPPASGLGVVTLKHNGFYSREFAQCYMAGTAVGACAAVVNPTASSATITGLRGTYGHQASFTGTGIITTLGDTYTLSVTSSTAPTSLAAGTAALLFP